jgi:hypothetical protein
MQFLHRSMNGVNNWRRVVIRVVVREVSSDDDYFRRTT